MKKFLFISIITFLTGCWSKEDAGIVKVKDKQLYSTSHGSHYRIYTENEVFCIDDTLWFWRFNSSDMYGKITINKCYKITVFWARIPILGWYRNILEAKEVKCK